MKQLLRLGLVTALAATLSGCAAYDSDGFWNNATSFMEGQATDAAVAALAKGDLKRAEAAAMEALKRNPRDPLALLVVAQVYQASNRPDVARQYYYSVIGLNSTVQATGFGLPGPAVARPVGEIAEYNIALLEGRTPPRLSGTVSPAKPVVAVDLGDTDQVIARFVALRRLLDEGLLTQQEHDERRAANLGALLPMTKSAPAAGLDAAAPQPDEVVQRLKAINASLEIKAITPREHAIERATILDGLLPAAPQKLGQEPPPPTDVLESADRLARLERIRSAKVISQPEFAAERQAIISAVEAAAKRSQVAASGGKPAPAKAKATAPAKPTGKANMGVHLASLRSADQANKEWAALKSKHAELKTLKPTVQKVDLGQAKGSFFRLKAGPLTKAQAEALCKALKAKGQFCDPMAFGK